MSRKIIGVTVGTTLPKPNFKQDDPTKGDYIINKPDFDSLNDRVNTVSGLVGDTPVAVQISNALFSGKVGSLSAEEIEVGFKDVPSISVSEDLLLIDALVNCGGAQSKREARTFIQSGAVSVNGEVIKDLEFVIKQENAIENKFTIVRRGKKNYYLIKH